MTLLRDKHSHHFDLCMKKNQTMIEWNDTFTKSASSIIEEISSVNLSFPGNGKYVKHNVLIVVPLYSNRPALSHPSCSTPPIPLYPIQYTNANKNYKREQK